MSNDELERLAAEMKKVSTLHEKVGKVIYHDLGGELRCQNCGTSLPLTPELSSRYIAVGWPKHCSLTMTWFTARQLAEGQ